MKTIRLFKRVSELLSLCIFLGGSVVLIGWIFDIPVLKSILPKFVTMKANTAICFILIGLSLWLSQEKRADNRLCRGMARFCAFTVFLTGFLTFCEYMLGWNLGVDQLLFKESANAVLMSSAPGRMAFNTSISFLILGLALLMAEAKTVILSYLAQFLIILVGAIALLSLVGYFYGADLLYISLRFSTAQALHTCVLFIMSCMGCLFLRPDQGLMKEVSSDSFGGIVLRRILPAVIFVPLALGGFKIYGEHTRWFSNEFGVSFVAICNLLIVSLFVYILSIYLNRLDAKHKAATEATRESEARYKALFAASPEGILVVDLQTKQVRYVNPAICGMFGYTEEEFLRIGVVDIHPKESLNHVLAEFEAQARGEKPMSPDIPCLRKDGAIYYANISSIKIVLDGRKCTVGFFNDITEHKLAEEALRENKEKIHLLLNSTAEAIYGIDTNGICTFCNSSCLRLLGYKHPDELLGKNMHWRIHAKRSDGTFFPIEECRVFRAFKKGEGVHVDDEVFWRSDGTSFPAEYWSYPQLHNGAVVGAVMTFLDITERKRAEENLWEKTAFLEAHVESSLDGILVVDGSGNRILINEHLLNIWKVPDEIRRQSEDEALLQYVVSKTKYPDQFLAKVKYLYEHPNETSRDEIEFKDGTVFDRCSSGVFGKNGKHYGRTWTFRDITDRKRAEERIRESEEKFKTLYESSRDAIMILSSEKGFLHGNHATVELFGCKDLEEFISKTPTDLSPPYQPDGTGSAVKAQQMMATAMKEGSHFFEWTHKRIDGTEFFATVLLTKMELKDQPVLQATVRDITDYKNAEEELIQAKIQAEAANTAKGQFLANMSHEIRTPMNAIMGFCEVLSEEELTDQQKEYVNTIGNSGRHLLQVINDILDFSKIEAGKLDVEKNECSLKNLLAVIESMIYPSVIKKGLKFEIQADSGLPAEIHTDCARVQQCLINLVNNAVKFTAKGHVIIHVSLENKNNQPCIRFDVEDTGIGIPADKQQMIFEPFTQASGDTSRKYGGTGLGLTITKQLAALLGGELTLTSEEGKGSVFSLVIPAGLDVLEQRQLSTPPEPEKKHELNETRYAGRILVVEDNPTNQFLVQTLLAKLGPQCVLACDGVEAVEKAAAESFDLILMDIQMPNMNGYQAAQALRKKGVKTPIVALTAHAMESDRQKCIDAGCDDHMAKPINRTRLLEVLDRYLNPHTDSLTGKVEKLCEETKELTDICRQTSPPDKSQSDKPAGTSVSE